MGEGGGSSPWAGDSTIEINEWSGLLNYEQEVAVNQPFHDTIRYTPLIKKGSYVQSTVILGPKRKKNLSFMVQKPGRIYFYRSYKRLLDSYA